MIRERTSRGAIARVLVCAAALALSATIYNRYRGDLRRARERISSRKRIAQTSSGPVEYATVGEGSPVLVVHGAGGGFDQGLDFAGSIAERGFRVIAMSRFGYLGTPMHGDASAASQADAHAHLLDALGIERAAIIGASAGAPSSVQFALRHPGRCAALVLVVPAAYVPRPAGAPSMKTPRWTRTLFETALRSDFLFWVAKRIARPTLTRAILATPTSVVQAASTEERKRVETTLDHILPVSSRRRGLLNDAAVTSSLSPLPLERIAAPTLVISAADDLFGTLDGARYTAQRVPGARFVGYESGGHVLAGRQADLDLQIVEFVRRASV